MPSDKARSRVETIYGLLSIDGRIDQKNKPNAKSVPYKLRRHIVGRLGRIAIYGRVYL